MYKIYSFHFAPVTHIYNHIMTKSNYEFSLDIYNYAKYNYKSTVKAFVVTPLCRNPSWNVRNFGH